MIAAAKAFIKSILPPPILARVAAVRTSAEQVRFALQPRTNFNPSNLMPRERLDLAIILSSPEAFASWEKDHEVIKAIYGEGEVFAGANPGDRRALYYLLRVAKPRNVLEIGTHVGASTINMAMALRANGFGLVTTVDIVDVNDGPLAQWRILGLSMPPRGMVRSLDCAQHVEFITAQAQDYMRHTDRRFDLIFLDGDHRPSAVYAELSLALKLLAPGGLVLLHDYYDVAKTTGEINGIIEGPFLALQRATRENSTIFVQPLGNLPWQTKKGSNFTSLAAVVRCN